MSIHQLALMIAEIAVVLASWRVHPALGVFMGVVALVATARAFVEIRWRQLQRVVVSPGMEWSLVGSSLGVVLLIVGSVGLVLILPFLSMAVIGHLWTGLAALGAEPVAETSPASKIPGVLLLLGLCLLIGFGLALNLIGALTFYLGPIAPTAGRGWRRVRVVMTVWLSIFTMLGGLELVADWLAMPPPESTAAVTYRANSWSSSIFPIWLSCGAALVLVLWCRPGPEPLLPP